MSNHAKYCNCYECTGNDSYMKRLRNNYARTAGINHLSSLSTAPVKTTTLNTVSTPPIAPTASKANMKDILGDVLGGFVGDLIQAKKSGETLPKALDVVATLGIKTEKAAINAAQASAEKEIGKNVLQFSPFIIAAIVGVVVLLLYFMFKK